mmetsp:Transcript_44867/g.129665  ORF Transcript_44867/g.129665 Transcript_44867/m.129665 type:complete len:309 (+) Transcript_44867:100-1026(+)
MWAQCGRDRWSTAPSSSETCTVEEVHRPRSSSAPPIPKHRLAYERSIQVLPVTDTSGTLIDFVDKRQTGQTNIKPTPKPQPSAEGIASVSTSIAAAESSSSDACIAQEACGLRSESVPPVPKHGLPYERNDGPDVKGEPSVDGTLPGNSPMATGVALTYEIEESRRASEQDRLEEQHRVEEQRQEEQRRDAPRLEEEQRLEEERREETRGQQRQARSLHDGLHESSGSANGRELLEGPRGGQEQLQHSRMHFGFHKSNGSANGRERYRGPQGGIYHISSSGRRVYERKLDAGMPAGMDALRAQNPTLV